MMHLIIYIIAHDYSITWAESAFRDIVVILT